MRGRRIHPPLRFVRHFPPEFGDLNSWLAQLVADKPHRERAGELPEVEIAYVRRAIEEIERLRKQVASK